MERSIYGRHEILIEVFIEATDEVVIALKEVMEKTGRTLLKAIPVEAEVVIVGSWEEM